MSGIRIARCDPTLLDFVTWAVMKGCRLFQRIGITPPGLVATERIPEFDFVAIVPVTATQSVLSIASDPDFPLRVSPEEHGESVPFWDDVTRGSFAFVGFLTKVLLTGHPRGLKSYLNVLPLDEAMPISKLADAAQATKGYKEWTAPLVAQCKVEESDFDVAFRRAYCLFRRHAIPFWSTNDASSAGHPYFEQSLFAQRGRGELMGMVPVMDLALHSPKPNSMIGFPDEEMLRWLSQQKRVMPQEKGCFVLQALRDIEEGEVITVDKNVHFNFDDDAFKAWFGYSNTFQVAAETAECSAVRATLKEENLRL
ncbi:hypothetical protein LSCM1_01147 [Leishmania martiniquensis]|uniref:SET domain-containing protein n=1 Tax=Leishmania martiniquensis TaxID=1580590 RepID=A0A836K8B2_9TRYP|nr:hypothetical protein LSCM1_01147 [Leishmania martiniquensis]